MTLSSLDHWCPVIPLKVIYFNYSFSLLFQATPQFPVEFVTFHTMSTRCVRYIQSCVSPFSQAHTHTHTRASRPFSYAHAAQRCAAGLRREGRGLWPAGSVLQHDERAPQLRGHSHTHTHTHASGHLRSVFASLCCWRWWWGSPLAFLPQIIPVRRLCYSHWFGLVLLKRHAFGLDDRVLKRSSQPLTRTRSHPLKAVPTLPSEGPPLNFSWIRCSWIPSVKHNGSNISHTLSRSLSLSLSNYFF